MNANITQYGASINLENNAPAIQKAIDYCHSSGGGRVTVPAGRYVTGTIRLRDNVELYLECGAVLRASTDSDTYNTLEEYPQNGFSTNEGWDYRHLILGVNVKNASITGLGTIEGCSDYWFAKPGNGGYFGWRDGFANTKDRDKGVLRPGQLIVFIESSDIRMTDITVTGSTCWCCFFHGCVNVQIKGLRIFADKVHANTDGIDIDCCRYVAISDCIIDTGDDSIAIRGSATRLSDKTAVCEYVTITNCVLASSSDAFRIGVGISAVKHLRVSNIVVHRAANLIDFNTSYLGKGHCELDDISFSNISAANLSSAFKLNTSDVKVSRVTVENIRAEVMASSEVIGNVQGIISDVTLRNIDLFVKPTHIGLTPEIRKYRGEYVFVSKNVDDLRVEGMRIFFDEGVRELWTGEKSVDD